MAQQLASIHWAEQTKILEASCEELSEDPLNSAGRQLFCFTININQFTDCTMFVGRLK